MTERKPITADLRRWWELHCRTLATPELDEGLDALCGAIDAVHANLEGESESLRRELDRALGEWDYWESTHVELPKDADGEVVRIGDVMDEKLPFGGYAAPASVDTMELSRGASGYVWMVKLDAENSALINPKLLRHHQPDTWERIIEDALDGYHDTDFDKLVARCRALAGDAR